MSNKIRLPGGLSVLGMDMLAAVLVILVVVTFVVPKVSDKIKGVKVLAATASATGLWSNYIMAYRAIHGHWPEGKQDLREFIPDDDTVWGPEDEYPNRGPNYKEIRLSGGTMDVVLSGPFEGKVLTIHPAVPEGDPLGPVKWVPGGGGSEGWRVIGEDHTTVDDRHILSRAIKR